MVINGQAVINGQGAVNSGRVINGIEQGGSPPDAPTLLTAVQNGVGQIDLAWTDNASNEDGFYIERSDGDNLNFVQIDTAAADAVSYSDTGLGSALYYYRVRAYNGAGESDYSNEANAFTHLLLVKFTTDDAPPVSNPYTGEVSSLAVTDVQSIYQVSGGTLNPLNVPAAASANNPRFFSTNTYTRTIGRVFYSEFKRLNNGTAGNQRDQASGWRTAADTTFNNVQGIHILNEGLVRLWPGDITLFHSDLSAYDLTFGTWNYLWVVMRNPGVFVFIKIGAGNKRLVWVDNTLTGDKIASVMSPGANYRQHEYDRMAVSDMDTPFDTQNGYATVALAGSQGVQSGTHEADSIFEFVATTLPSVGVIDFRFRIQDASNYWQVTIDSAGNLVLNEVVATVATARGGAAAGVITAGERVVITADDVRIATFDSTARRQAYVSAANFKTETDWSIAGLGTGGVLSDLYVWPMIPSGAAETQLNFPAASG